MTLTQQDCRALDAQDPLRALREQFTLPEGVIYLDGNSLGALPKTAAARVAEAVTTEWGQGLIRSWNSAGWFDLPQRLGNKIAPLIGAQAGEVVATDSTSINLYKVLSAALNIAAVDSPECQLLVSERSNFPTDLYIAEGLCKARGLRLLARGRRRVLLLRRPRHGLHLGRGVDGVGGRRGRGLAFAAVLLLHRLLERRRACRREEVRGPGQQAAHRALPGSGAGAC